MKEINYPQLTTLSDDGFIRVIEQGSGGAFPALVSKDNLVTSIETSGSFTATLTGFSGTAPTVTVYYARVGSLVSLLVEDFVSGTSNATTMTATGLPAAITPLADSGISTCLVYDNGGNASGFVSALSSGAIQFGKNVSTSGFTATGQKGVIRFSYTYYLR